MEREEGYYWVRWDKEWVIAIYAYDDEQEKYCWYCNGMEIIKDPDEIDEKQIVHEPRTN